MPRIAGVAPYAEGEGWVLYCGDVLDLVPRVPAGSIDVVLTDPPYLVAAKSQGGNSKAGGFGVDIDPHWCDVAAARLRAAEQCARATHPEPTDADR